MKHKITILTTVLFLAYTCLFSQNLEYFDSEKEKYDSDYTFGLKFTLTLSTILILF